MILGIICPFNVLCKRLQHIHRGTCVKIPGVHVQKASSPFVEHPAFTQCRAENIYSISKWRVMTQKPLDFNKIKGSLCCDVWVYICRRLQKVWSCEFRGARAAAARRLFFHEYVVRFVWRSAGYSRASVKLNFVAKCQCRMQWEVSVTDAPTSRRPLCLWLN